MTSATFFRPRGDDRRVASRPAARSASRPAAPQPAPEIAVWDRAVRAFHWLLVATVGVALVTGLWAPPSWHDVHLWSGIAAAVLVGCRLVWGLLGPTYARFSSFRPSVSRALAHLDAIRRNREPRHIGHNPLGALMIVALIGAVTVLTVTGLLVLGGVSKEGPLAAFTSFRTGATALTAHAYVAYALAGLVILHVLGALHDGPVMLRAMITGTKPAGTDAITAPEKPARPHPAVRTIAVAVAVAVVGTAVLSAKPVPGIPTAPLDPLYAKECGACHTPHHPSVAPARTWAAIVAGLDDHFGDDASLSAADTRRIADWLAANSAEKFDTAAANLMRTPSDTDPLRITATPGWRRLHADVPDAVFARRTVGGRLACSACHADADSGRFAARQISIPNPSPETKRP